MDHPILFSAPMVRAILEGRKTQTRRIVRHSHLSYAIAFIGEPRQSVTSPYGKTGDRVWVREALRIAESGMIYDADGAKVATKNIPCGWEDKPRRVHVTSMFMPRWASRITLEITDVRVQRLQDISDEDAMAEGVSGERYCESCRKRSEAGCYPYTHNFAELWESINGKKYPWDANPWVWAVTFNRVETPEEIKP